MILLRDACNPESTSHAQFSLHKWGIDHSQSFAEQRLVIKIGAEAQALDFYFIKPGTRPTDFIDDLLKILALRNWGGIGIYPDWKPYPGFHIDTRDPGHRFYRTWWIGYKNDDGRQDYIYHPSFSHLQQMANRGFRPNGCEW